MPNYDKTIIYKIVNYDFPHLVYVGSTTNFTKRKQHHKEGCSNLTNKNTIRKYTPRFVKMVVGKIGI